MATPDSENPGWLEVAVDAAPELNDPLSAFFFDLGCTGVVFEDFGNRTLKAYLPLKESPEENRHRIQIYLGQLASLHPHLPPSAFRLTKIEHQDWQKNWRRFFRPVRVTPRLLILPVWEKVPSHPKETHVIRLDPGPAFGTGQHATTKMCLRSMESIGARKGDTLLDVGTGSGILAIYGVKLGFGRIEAIDVDPEAVRWARRNMALNGVADAISLSETAVEALGKGFTVICANLMLGELLRLMPELSRLVDAGGHVIVSGILRDQVERINAALPAAELFTVHTLFEEEWACMVLKKGGE